MFDLFVRIYTRENYNKNKKQLHSCYRAMFAVMPNVGDYIARHIRIEGSADCQVMKIMVILKPVDGSTDADAFVEAVVSDDLNLLD